MTAAQAGHRAAYESVLAESVTLIRATALAHHVPAAAAEQVVHATLQTMHAMRHTYDPALSFRRWLDAIAAHHVRQMTRSGGELTAP